MRYETFGRWRTLPLLTLFALLTLLSGCVGKKPVSEESFVFGTRVEVLIYGVPSGQAHAAAGAVLREFDRLHHAYHAWQPSELTALNAAIADGRPARVSAELAGLIRNAQGIAAQGDHLFDPGIGRLIGLWGFQNDTFPARLPEAQVLRAWRTAHPSIADVTVNPEEGGDGSSRVVVSRNRAVALDFGGYLKGVALDRAAAILKAQGIDNALVNIGGNLIALGSKGGTPWRIAIQHPRATAPLAMLDLRDGEAIGTSGDYQRYFELDGRRYCHLLDPRSAAPAQGTQAVTVLIPPGVDAGMRSDALSKPLFIAGDDWPVQARRLGIDHALRIDAAGTVQVTGPLRTRLDFGANDMRIVTMP